MDSGSAKGAAAAEMGLIESKLEVKFRCFDQEGVLEFDLSYLGAGTEGSTAWAVRELVIRVMESIA